MTVKELLIKFWNTKKYREIAILILLLIAFGIVIAIILKPQDNNYSIKLLICKSCREPETRSYLNLKSQLCNKCEKKGNMLYSYKCSKCDYEFGVKPIPKNQIEGLSKRKRAEKNTYHKQCPNCNSIETYSLVDYQELKKAIKIAKEKREAEKNKKLPSAPIKKKK